VDKRLRQVGARGRGGATRAITMKNNKTSCPCLLSASPAALAAISALAAFALAIAGLILRFTGEGRELADCVKCGQSSEDVEKVRKFVLQSLQSRENAGFAGSLSEKLKFKLKSESEGLRLNLNSRLKRAAKPPRCRPFRAHFSRNDATDATKRGGVLIRCVVA
jgi:hypothetical protein